MTCRWDGKRVDFRPADSGQVGDVLAMLDESAAWLRSRGITQWPDRFEADWVAPAISRGETWIVAVDGSLAATATLDWSDPLWSDRAGEAAYIHRMAVRRWAAGLGSALLSWATDTARAHGRHFLRLDCVAGNDRLRAYYAAAGFRHCGDVQVGGAPGQRLSGGEVTIVSRYELRIDT